MTDVAVERLEMTLDQVEEDARHLEAGEHVSGPSAVEYHRRVTRTAPFVGRIVITARNAEKLLASTDPAVHHGEGMTCVWRAATAACRAEKIAAGLPADEAPDESQCRSACTNLAYTDRDIRQLQERMKVLHSTARDPLAPLPRRERAAAQASHLASIIQQHEQSRPQGASSWGGVS